MFHVLNRGVGRMELFSKEKDYAAFETLLEQTRESRPMRICAYCLMPNHWHFVLWPEREGELAAFMQQPQTEAELAAIRRCVARGQPYGGEAWVRRTAEQLGLESTLRAPHRPKKTAQNQ